MVTMKALTKKWKVGDKVTPKEAVAAYYSGYGGQPVSNLTPGTQATVVAIVPPVTGPQHYLLIVDYDDAGMTRRASLRANNVVKV